MEEVAEFFKTQPCWQDHCKVVNLKQIHQDITLKDLEEYLNREPNFTELFNWIENKNLNSELTVERLDRHDWRAHVNKQFKGMASDPYRAEWVHSPVSLEDLRKHLPEASWQQYFNCNRGKPLSEPITDEDLNGYFESNQISLFQGWTNIALDRDADHPIRDEDLDHPYWQTVVAACLKLPFNAPVLKWHFESVINRKVTRQEYINCIYRRPLTHRISVEQMEIYLDRPLTLAEKAKLL